MPHGGNVNIMTVMGDARMDGLSDAGSTPARSTKKTSRTFCMKNNNGEPACVKGCPNKAIVLEER